jgi:hypothetical protein
MQISWSSYSVYEGAQNKAFTEKDDTDAGENKFTTRKIQISGNYSTF